MASLPFPTQGGRHVFQVLCEFCLVFQRRDGKLVVSRLEHPRDVQCSPFSFKHKVFHLHKALHTLTCVQVLLGLSKFPLFPFSHFIEALVLVERTVVNKEEGWCELKCCRGDTWPESLLLVFMRP